MLDEKTFFKCKWIIAKNELANVDKQGPQEYQKPLGDNILDIHARVTGIHTGLVAAKTSTALGWVGQLDINLQSIDKWKVGIDTNKIPDIGINWNEFEILPMSDTINTVYEFLYTHKDRTPTVFNGDFWYYEKIIKNKIDTADQLNPNDVLIISFPFFKDFKVKKDMDDILEKCSAIGVPVLLDCIWLPLINNFTKLKNADAVEVITQSITKTLPLSATKGGIVFKRKPLTYVEVIYPIGNKLGKGDGKEILTLAGILMGASIANDAEKAAANGKQTIVSQEVCEKKVRQKIEKRLSHYKVTVDYNGTEVSFSSKRRPYDDEIKVEVSVDGLD